MRCLCSAYGVLMRCLFCLDRFHIYLKLAGSNLLLSFVHGFENEFRGEFRGGFGGFRGGFLVISL